MLKKCGIFNARPIISRLRLFWNTYFACVTFMGTEMLFQWKRGQIENY
jgi:hypothetical protein